MGVRLASVAGYYGPDAASTQTQPGVPGGGAGMGAGPTSTTTAAMGAPKGSPKSVSPTALIPAGLANSTFLGQPLPWIAAVVGVLFAIHALSHRTRNAAEFGTVKVGAENILLVTLMAVLGITTLKMILTKYQVGGLTTLVQAV